MPVIIFDSSNEDEVGSIMAANEKAALKVNAWMRENPGVEVISREVKTSAMGELIFVIWYEEEEEMVAATASDRGETNLADFVNSLNFGDKIRYYWNIPQENPDMLKEYGLDEKHDAWSVFVSKKTGEVFSAASFTTFESMGGEEGWPESFVELCLVPLLNTRGLTLSVPELFEAEEKDDDGNAVEYWEVRVLRLKAK